MVKKLLLPIALIFFSCFFFQKRSSFDLFMSKANPDFVQCYHGKWAHQWKLLKRAYDHLNHSTCRDSRIPKIIHQIWLGGKIPSKYLPLQKSWIEKHPDWEYRLWTDEDLFSFKFSNQRRFEMANSFGEKSDILRYEILYQFGGLYVDVDFECIQPFDFFHEASDFYVGLEAPLETYAEAAIGNALIGSIPHHPILSDCLKRISKKPPAKNASEVLDISGPGCLRKAFFKSCRKSRFKNIAFPYTFFYPLPSQERDGKLGQLVKSRWIQPESFGIHYWDTSWSQ